MHPLRFKAFTAADCTEVFPGDYPRHCEMTSNVTEANIALLCDDVGKGSFQNVRNSFHIHTADQQGRLHRIFTLRLKAYRPNFTFQAALFIWAEEALRIQPISPSIAACAAVVYASP
jgi:hypothetical protein